MKFIKSSFLLITTMFKKIINYIISLIYDQSKHGDFFKLYITQNLNEIYVFNISEKQKVFIQIGDIFNSRFYKRSCNYHMPYFLKYGCLLKKCNKKETHQIKLALSGNRT